jgi:hypothetical protein
MVIAIWILTVLGLGLWSLVAWGLHALLGLDGQALLGDLKPLIAQIPYGAVIEQWVPGWQGLLEATLALAKTLLGWLGSAGPVLVWVLWGIGAAVLLAIAAVLTLIVVIARRATAPARPAAA